LIKLLLQCTTFVFVVLILRALWQAGRPHRHFTIRLADGEPKVVKGTATPALLRLVNEVASYNNLKKGWISGVASGSVIRLEFSKSIPEPARQQMRNGWGILRWKPSSSPARKR
jgi:hypothetical protein